MTDVACAADAVVNLEVPVVVPGDRSHPVALIEAQLVECTRDLSGSFDLLSHGVPVTGIVHRHGDDFLVSMEFLSVFCDR